MPQPPHTPPTPAFHLDPLEPRTFLSTPATPTPIAPPNLTIEQLYLVDDTHHRIANPPAGAHVTIYAKFRAVNLAKLATFFIGETRDSDGQDSWDDSVRFKVWPKAWTSGQEFVREVGVWTVTPGQTIITADLDSDGQIAESDETDNQASITVDGGEWVPTVFPNLPRLHSLADASSAIYLDFDGNLGDHATPVFGMDNHPSSLSADEIKAIRTAWSIVAEDYAPFNVDVTTVEPTPGQYQKWVRVCIGGSAWDWFNHAVGGIGGSPNFSSSNPAYPAYVFQTYDPVWMGNAISHEAGHSFGLAHQASYSKSGKFISEYNQGKGNWAPIMGTANGPYATWYNGPTPPPPPGVVVFTPGPEPAGTVYAQLSALKGTGTGAERSVSQLTAEATNKLVGYYSKSGSPAVIVVQGLLPGNQVRLKYTWNLDSYVAPTSVHDGYVTFTLPDDRPRVYTPAVLITGPRPTSGYVRLRPIDLRETASERRQALVVAGVGDGRSDGPSVGENGHAGFGDMILYGFGEADSPLEVSLSGVGNLGDTWINRDGRWKFDYSTIQLPSGDYTFTATTTPFFGSGGETASLDIHVDSASSAHPNITAGGAGGQNVWSGDLVASTSDYHFQGTAELGAKVALYVVTGNTRRLITTTRASAGDGSWTIAAESIESLPSDGAVDFCVQEMDSNDQPIGDQSPLFRLIEDTTAPALSGSSVTLNANGTAVDALTLTFSEGVSIQNSAGAEAPPLNDFTLLRDGMAVSWSDQKLTVDAPDEWTLSGLSHLKLTSGVYTLSLASGNAIVDSVGNQLTGDLTAFRLVVGTARRDTYLLRQATDPTHLAIYINDPTASADPAYDWPTDDEAPLVILAGAGNDSLTAELPAACVPQGGVFFSGGGGTDSLNVLETADVDDVTVDAGVISLASATDLRSIWTDDTVETLKLRSASGTDSVIPKDGAPTAWAPASSGSVSPKASPVPDGPGPNYLQDDMAILGANLGYRPDDYLDTLADATSLPTGKKSPLHGLINSTTDIDTFSLHHPGGQLTITLTPAQFPNLDAVLVLRDRKGKLIASSHPKTSFGASLTKTLPPGQYYICVKSTGVYGAVGQYTLTTTAAKLSD
jgi:hypothetical protein